MDVIICSYKPHSKGGILCLPKGQGHKNIWLPEGSLTEFTSSKYGEVSVVHDGVDNNGYFLNPRPTGAVGLGELVDTSAVESYFEARKKAKITLTLPQDIWGDLREDEDEDEVEIEIEEAVVVEVVEAVVEVKAEAVAEAEVVLESDPLSTGG